MKEIVTRLTKTLYLDDVVIGGGNAKKLKELPKSCRLGDNANAFIGGFRLWRKESPGRDNDYLHAAKSRTKKKGTMR